MKQFFRELFEYNLYVNQQVCDSIESNAGAVTASTVGLFSHLLNAHQIWNSRIDGNAIVIDPWTVSAAAAFQQANLVNHQKSLELIEIHNLDTIINYTNTKGLSFQNSIRDILFHIINHSTYHRAQIATACKQSGIQPVVSDYIIYRRQSFNVNKGI